MTPGRFQPLLVRPFDTIPDRLSFHLDGMKNPRGKIQSLVVIVKMNPAGIVLFVEKLVKRIRNRHITTIIQCIEIRQI